MMRIRQRVSLAVLLAFAATLIITGSALAHATEGDPSIVHQVLDSALTPLLALGIIGVVSGVWWRWIRQQES